MAQSLQKGLVIHVLRDKRWHISSLINLNVVISMPIHVVSEAYYYVMNNASFFWIVYSLDKNQFDYRRVSNADW